MTATPLNVILLNEHINGKNQTNKLLQHLLLGYVTIKKIGDYNNINSVNHLYLMINEMTGHVEEKNENKYLVLDDIDENKEVLKKYEEVWEGIKKQIEIVNSGNKIEYGEDF